MAESLPRIDERFTCDDDCSRCGGGGIVCENHADRRWTDTEGGCMCGAGMPCRPENRTVLGVMPVDGDG